MFDTLYDLFGGSLFFSIFFFILAIIVLYRAIKIVPQSEEWMVERFGKFKVVLNPGLNVLIPFVDAVSYKISMREQVLDVPSQDVITKDNAMVRVDGVIFYQVVDAVKASYEVEELGRAINNLTMTNIRTVMGSMDLDDLLSNREKINLLLLKVVDEATNPWGIKVTRIEIKDIRPPEDLVSSMARQMKAEREKRAYILEAEGIRASEIVQAEGAKQAAILRAEGAREAAYKEAEARERLAEAEATATKMVSEAISKGNIQAINYFIAEKYVDAFKELAGADNQKVMLLPMESTNLLGSLAGIAEIAKEAFKGNSTEAKKTIAKKGTQKATKETGPWE
jgi:regulator of protease activity HflC (stomatin/prohibitin superfamily)